MFSASSVLANQVVSVMLAPAGFTFVPGGQHSDPVLPSWDLWLIYSQNNILTASLSFFYRAFTLMRPENILQISKPSVQRGCWFFSGLRVHRGLNPQTAGWALKSPLVWSGVVLKTIFSECFLNNNYTLAIPCEEVVVASSQRFCEWWDFAQRLDKRRNFISPAQLQSYLSSDLLPASPACFVAVEQLTKDAQNQAVHWRERRKMREGSTRKNPAVLSSSAHCYSLYKVPGC